MALARKTHNAFYTAKSRISTQI